MKNKFKLLLVMVLVTFCVSLISNTYSRYVIGTDGNLEMQFAKWQILINENDVTNGNASRLVIAPTLEVNDNIKEGTFAPTSKGYFDILINPSNVEVSFDYNISLDLLNENMPDLLISNYAIIDENYIEGDTLELNTIEGSTITGTLDYNNADEDFTFKPFTIRVYFEWYDGIDENMNNDADTAVASLQNNLEVVANILFTQKI